MQPTRSAEAYVAISKASWRTDTATGLHRLFCWRYPYGGVSIAAHGLHSLTGLAGPQFD